LSYETPIFGAPWSIPFEFPVYQWIVAVTSKLLHIRLDRSGRLISELFFVLSLVALWGILVELRVKRIHRLVFLMLILVSPQYIFWSRTFMIESTALFFCMAYLYFIIRYIRTRKIVDAGLGGLCGVLGALIKVTTFPAFALVGAVLYLYSVYRDATSERRGKLRDLLLSQLVPALCFALLPVLITSVWVKFTEHVRALNVVVTGPLSPTNLWTWNFGTLEQRYKGIAWIVMRVRTIPDILGARVVLLITGLGALLSRYTLIAFLISIGGFLSAFLIFTNLHVVHNYYPYSNGIFLLAAASWGIVGLLEGVKWRKFLGIGVLVFCVFNSITRYYDVEYPTQMNNVTRLDNLASAIKRVTQPTDVVLLFTQDWSSEIPYLSERRTLLWPRWMDQDMNAPTMKEAIRRLGDQKIGAIVFCDGAQRNTQLIGQAEATLTISQVPDYEDVWCAVYPSSGPRAAK
jgi:dolichyl-phosphate-mannose--protein O-mannosyl transferase